MLNFVRQKADGGSKNLQTMKFSTLDALDDFGLTMSTCLKKVLNWEVRKVVSCPLNTLEMKVPPTVIVFMQISSAATRS